jgi:hypothetical protein
MTYRRGVYLCCEQPRPLSARVKTASRMRACVCDADQSVVIDTYAYVRGGGTGESFSIADQDDVFLMEIFSKGPGHKGAVWVATKIPDGCELSSSPAAASTVSFVAPSPLRRLPHPRLTPTLGLSLH